MNKKEMTDSKDNTPELDADYKLIPMSEITDEARKIAVRWYEGVSELSDIREKHKLASDIINYARRFAKLKTNTPIEAIELKKAVEVLCNALAEDRSEGSYYYAWQANIAMAFKDEWHRAKKRVAIPMSAKAIHEIANQAAKNFLDLLIFKP